MGFISDIQEIIQQKRKTRSLIDAFSRNDVLVQIADKLGIAPSEIYTVEVFTEVSGTMAPMISINGKFVRISMETLQDINAGYK